jgi:hypothetical protein
MVVATRPDCAAPTGAPGELSTIERHGVRFLQVSRTGVTRGPAVQLDSSLSLCASAATSASGAGVVCCPGASVPAGSVRDPGEPWSQFAELSPGGGGADRQPGDGGV